MSKSFDVGGIAAPLVDLVGYLLSMRTERPWKASQEMIERAWHELSEGELKEFTIGDVHIVSALSDD